MKRRMTLGDFVVAYLRKIGVTHVFGIPGDLALKLFFTLGRKHGLKMLTLSHEPGVGFAADGYARATGKIGVVCVTYGAGGHNMVNPVAGSFSERVPVLIFSGGPGEGERKLGTLIHHQAREIESQQRIYREVTCALKVLTDPRTAAEELHEVVQAVWAEQRPGYIEIHRDMVDQEIEVPTELIAWDGQLNFRPSDPRQVEEAARETVEMFNAASKPALVAGIEIHRYKLSRELITLAERMGAPVLSTVLGKGAFPMDHPLFMGVQVADISAPSIVERMDAADLVINLGCLKTDMNFGNQPPHIVRERSIWAVDCHVDVRFHTYTDVSIRDFVHALLRHDLQTRDEQVRYADNLNGAPPASRRRAAAGARYAARTQPFYGRSSKLRRRRGIGRYAFCRSGRARAARRSVSRPGFLRLDGLRGSGRDGRRGGQRRAAGGAMRRRRFSDDRAGNLAFTDAGGPSDRDCGQQQRMANLSAGRRSSRVIGNSAVALRQTGRRLGRSRLRSAHARRTAHRAGASAREQDLRNYRRPRSGRRPVADNDQVHPGRSATLAGAPASTFSPSRVNDSLELAKRTKLFGCPLPDHR